jgi:hypothetical protein
MGRELKRVPLDFDWPLNKVWRGYVNPFGGPCPEDGKTCWNGNTAAGKWLDAVAGLLSVIGGDAADAPRAEELRRRGRIYPHPYLEEWPQAPRTETPRAVMAAIREMPEQGDRMRALHDYHRANPSQLLPLTPEIVALTTGLSGRSPERAFGHDAIDRWSICKAIRDAAKLPESWGTCPACEGHADDPAQRKQAEAWEREHPPFGDGYQLWETTSEGSPISPVFPTLDALCEWAADNATTFGSNKASADEWRKMLDDGLVCHREGNMVFL